MSVKKPLYCFDTSSYIRAWHEAYPPDVVETFWKLLDDAISRDIVISPDEVLVEMKKRSNDLHRWLKTRDQCIVEIDDPLQEAVAKLLAAHPTYSSSCVRRGGGFEQRPEIAMDNQPHERSHVLRRQELS